MTSEFWAAIAGALVGAVVGGAVAALLQYLSLGEAKKQRDEDREESRKALGRALLFKMIRIHSNLLILHRHLEDSIEGAAAQGFKGELWQVVLPLANHPDRVNFTSDEASLILSIKEDALFNSLLSMDHIHNSLIDVFETFRECRAALTASLPARGKGPVLSSELTEAQMLVARPMMVELNQLISVMRPRSKKDYQESLEVLHKLAEVLKAKLSFSFRLEFDAPMSDTTAKKTPKA